MVLDKLIVLFILVLKKIVEILPFKISLFIISIFGTLSYYFMRKRRKITISNICRAFPEKNRKWCYVTAKQVFKNFGRNFIEFIKFSSGNLLDYVEIKGLEKLEDGSILMTGHIGNWEITGIAVTASGKKLYAVIRRIHNLGVDKIVNELRASFGGGTILSRGSLREILKKIKKKQSVCILIDQRIKNGLPVLFFNRPVWCTHIISILARKTGVKIIPAYSYHKDDKLKIVYGDSLKMDVESVPLKADFINTQRQMKWIESKIKERPDEWFWLHNFWKDKWRAVFLDRDGTINEDYGYVSKKENFKFIDGTFEALRSMRAAGYLLVVVTNQSGIARGYYSNRDYEKVNEYFMNSLEKEGVIIDRVYYCRHHPDDNCLCRKPGPNMVLRAQKELNIDLQKSFVIGDKTSDIKLGNNLNMKTILVLTGEGEKHKTHPECRPTYIAKDLSRATKIILDGKSN